MTVYELIVKLMAAELGDGAADGRRAICAERMKLQSTLHAAPETLTIDKPAAIAQQMAEAVRVARMWGTKL